jgi:cytochrome P450
MYWEDPLEFRPERFLGPYDKDAFVPFSAGPRVSPHPSEDSTS